MLSLSRAAVSAAVTVSSKKSTSAITTTKLAQRTLARSVATKASSNNGNNNHGSSSSSSSSSSKFFGLEALMALGLSVATATTGVTLLDAATSTSSHYPQPKQIQVDELTPATIPSKPRLNEPPPRPDLPTYSREEVSEHCDEDSLWYTFRGAVYDLTFFYKGHPGGSPVRLVVFRLLISFFEITKRRICREKIHVMHINGFSPFDSPLCVFACLCFQSFSAFNPSFSLYLSPCIASVDGCRSRLGTVLGGTYSSTPLLVIMCSLNCFACMNCSACVLVCLF